MRELFHLPARSLGEDAQAAVMAWTKQIANKVRVDLYHYGQASVSRINRLRLAAYSRSPTDTGTATERCLNKYGQFDVRLSP